MKRRIMKIINTKGLFALKLILLSALYLSIFSSCQGNQGGSRQEDKHINHFKSGASYTGRAVDLGLAEDEIPLDILEEEDGYRLLVGKSISPDTPFPQEDGTTLYYLSGVIRQTEYRFLKEDFTPSGKKAVPTEGHMISAERIDGVLYEFRGTPHIEIPDGDDDGTRYAEFLDAALYADGKELWSIATDRNEGFFLAQGPAAAANDGRTVYQHLTGRQWIYAGGKKLSPAGNASAGVCGILRLGDTVYCLLHDTDERALLVPLSPDMKEIEKKGTGLKANATGACASDGETGFFFSGTALYATDGKDCRELTDLARYGFSSATVIRRILPLSDGRILVLGDESLVELSPKAEAEEKPVITLGTIREYGNDDLPKRVLRYNLQSDKYAIKIRNFDTPEDLNKALLSGEIGLLASSDRILLRNYAEKGLLLDLEEGMPALFEDGVLYENLVDAVRVKEKAYYLPRTFQLYGYRIKESAYPEDGFRTMDDFFRFLDGKGTAFKKSCYRELAFQFYGLRLDEWIDWEAGTCRFNDGDFERVLTFCASCPDRDTTEAYRETHGGDPSGLAALQVIRPSAFFDIEPYVAFWLPSRVHTGPEISAPYFMGIVKNGEYEEASKDFMDFTFLKDLAQEGETELDISINREENRRVNYHGDEDQAEEKKLEEWIRKADEYSYWDNELLDVLTEEANRYFAGEITAEKAAEYIQNRVSIYLAEQG